MDNEKRLEKFTDQALQLGDLRTATRIKWITTAYERSGLELKTFCKSVQETIPGGIR